MIKFWTSLITALVFWSSHVPTKKTIVFVHPTFPLFHFFPVAAYDYMDISGGFSGGFPGGFPCHFPGTVVKNPPTSAGDARDLDSVPGLGRFPKGGNGNPLQYAWLEYLPWTEEHRGLQSTGSQRVRHDWATFFFFFFSEQLSFSPFYRIDLFITMKCFSLLLIISLGLSAKWMNILAFFKLLACYVVFPW